MLKKSKFAKLLSPPNLLAILYNVDYHLSIIILCTFVNVIPYIDYCQYKPQESLGEHRSLWEYHTNSTTLYKKNAKVVKINGDTY